MIWSFLDDHSTACAKNWVCRKLRLAEAVVRPMSLLDTSKKHARSPSTKSPKKVVKKSRLDYILIDDSE
jgi:hypothetical protein